MLCKTCLRSISRRDGPTTIINSARAYSTSLAASSSTQQQPPVAGPSRQPKRTPTRPSSSIRLEPPLWNRGIHRSYATVIPHSIKNPTVDSATGTKLVVTPPSLEAIKQEGYLDEDVELLSPEEATIKLTPAAVNQLLKITSREPPDVLKQGKLALRVGVESGGCHGYQYTMAITEERGVDDYVMQPEGVECIPVVVDLISLGLLKGSTLTFTTELIGSSFQIESNPQAKQGGNCGCGVSWELEAPTKAA